MDYTEELNAYRELTNVWVSIYKHRQVLGSDHEQWETLNHALRVLNDAACEFHRYLPDDEELSEIKRPVVIGVTTSL